MNHSLKRNLLATTIAALALVGGCQNFSTSETTVAPDSIVVSPNDQRSYETLTLANGIDVILVSDPKAEKAAASLSVGVGLLNDPMEQQGMAHYVEHMLFLGTEKYPEPDEYLGFMTQNGGTHNAYTWLDITNYQFKVNPEVYDEALDRFSDFFKKPLFTPKLIDKERNAVNAEWSMRRELDFFGAYKLDRSMMGEHPANRFLIGNLETLSDKPSSKLLAATKEFYNRYYSSNIMKVAMISSHPLNDMREYAKKHFSSIPNKSIEKPTVKAKLAMSEVGQKLIHFVPNKDEKTLKLSFVIENNIEDFRTKPNVFLSHLISSEMPGTPATAFRQNGWISSLNTSINPASYGNYGSFDIVVKLTDKGMANREVMTGALLNYIDQIQKEGIDEKYFNEIKISLENSFRFLEKADEFNYTSSLAAQMQLYPMNHAIDAAYRFEQFDADSINKVLDQLKPSNLRLWYQSKDEPTDKQLYFYTGKYKISDLSQKSIDEWKASAQTMDLSLPKVNTLLPENFDLVTEKTEKPQKRYDKNGIQVWQQTSQYFPDQPKGKTWVYLNQPLEASSIQEFVLLKLWQDLFTQNQVALISEASAAGMNVNLAGGNGLFLSVSGFTDKQPILVDKGLGALAADYTDETFAQVRDDYISGIKSSEVGFAMRQLSPAMNKLTKQAGWKNVDLIHTAEKLTKKHLDAFMSKALKENAIRAFMFGNYDQSDVERLISVLEHSLPNRVATPYDPSEVLKPSRGDVFVFQKDLPIDDLGLLDMYVSPNSDIKEVAVANVLSKHLKQQTFTVLRTQEQLAYAVGAFASRIKDHAALGFYIQTPKKSPVDMQARFDRFKSEYKAMLDDVSPEAFEKIKQGQLSALKEEPKNLNDEAGQLYSDWIQEKWDFDSREKLIAATEAVTLTDIKEFYQRLLLDGDAARINVQLKGKKFADEPFATLKGQTVVDDLTTFHNTMAVQ